MVRAVLMAVATVILVAFSSVFATPGGDHATPLSIIGPSVTQAASLAPNSSWPNWARTWGPASHNPLAVFLRSEAGYDVKGVKQIVVWRPIPTDQWGSPLTFTVNADDSQQVVLTGQLGTPFAFPWGGSAVVADLSTLDKPGRYVLSVQLPNVDVPLRSPEIAVTSGLYQRLGREAAIWFYPQRCGEAVPGWHSACHTDDGVLRNVGSDQATYGLVTGVHDATGGWHDGGDYNKWMAYGWMGVYALTEQWAVLGTDTREFGESLPDPLAEASHEVTLILKMQQADGLLACGVEGWHPNTEKQTNDPWAYWGTPETETDRKPGTGDERLVDQGQQWLANGQEEMMTAWTAAALAYFAQEVKPFDAALAQRSAEAAAKILAAYDREQLNASSMEALAGLLVAHLHLAIVQGESPDNDSTRHYAQALLKLHDLGTWDKPGSDLYHFPLFMIWGLIEYADTLPQTPLSRPIRADVLEYLQHVLQYSVVPGLGTLGAFSAIPVGSVDSLPDCWQGYNSYYAGMAYFLARAAHTCNDPALLQAADLQMQWILGRNPLGLSMMVGEGDNPNIYHTRYISIPGHEKGVVPGGIINGILPACHKDFGLDSSTPPNAPVLAVRGRLGNVAWWQTNEYWSVNNAWFILAAARLQKSYATPMTPGFSAVDWSNQVWRKAEQGR